MLKWLKLQNGTNIYLKYFWMRILHFVSQFLRSSSWSYAVVDDNAQFSFICPTSPSLLPLTSPCSTWSSWPCFVPGACLLFLLFLFHSWFTYSLFHVTSMVSAERNISLCHNMPHYLQWHNVVTAQGCHLTAPRPAFILSEHMWQ